MEWFNQVDATSRADIRELAEGLGARLDAKLDHLRSEMIKWMFIFWTGSVVTTTVLVLAVASALRR